MHIAAKLQNLRKSQLENFPSWNFLYISPKPLWNMNTKAATQRPWRQHNNPIYESKYRAQSHPKQDTIAC